MAKNKWFGTDGVRGVANVFPMTAEFALKLGMAAAELVCTKHHKAVIAKDTRVSCDMLEAALTAGLTAKGVDVELWGVLPTPAVTTFVGQSGADMAFMITASHNPYQDNGIKLIAADGDKFSDEVTAQLEGLIEQNHFECDKDKLGVVGRNLSVEAQYKARAAQISVDLSGKKIVADCANGCFSEILPDVLRRHGAEVVSLGTAPNGRNINEGCGSQHPEQMCETVKKIGADLGIAVDGDGDRIKICDNTGRLVKSEQVMAFLAENMQQTGENKNRPFASTKLSNTALERYITQKLGLKYLSTGVGERAVIKALKENGGVIGGEESGHIVLLDYSKSGDAMMVSLAVLRALAADGRKAAEIFPLFADDALYFENFKAQSTAQVKKIAAHPELQALVDEMSRKIGAAGRVVIHPSGTEPKIRIWVCGKDERLVKEIGQTLWAKIESLAKCA